VGFGRYLPKLLAGRKIDGGGWEKFQLKKLLKKKKNRVGGREKIKL
jgi:hypothetical protein